MNGAIAIAMPSLSNIAIEELVFIDAEDVNDEVNCTTMPRQFALHSFTDLEMTGNTQTINGQGSVIISVQGMKFDLDVLTENEVLNQDICETEPLSGTNTMSNGIDEYVYRFDGETDCGADGPTQMLSINGGAEEEVEGSSCSTVSSSSMLSLFGGLLALFYRRRRS